MASHKARAALRQSMASRKAALEAYRRPSASSSSYFAHSSAVSAISRFAVALPVRKTRSVGQVFKKKRAENCLPAF
eukprot:scaffold24420_cov66-Phaeocystis_antarctica.AAC.2